MEEKNFAVRLKLFIDYKGMTSSQFADYCGIARPTLSQLMSGRNKKISDILVGQIHARFPELSVLWLLFGEGDMLTVDNPEEVELSDNHNDNTEFKRMPKDDDGCACEENIRHLQDEKSEGVSNYSSEPAMLAQAKEISQLRMEIEALKSSPRKVSYITVYYDDSTFESFYPKR